MRAAIRSSGSGYDSRNNSCARSEPLGGDGFFRGKTDGADVEQAGVLAEGWIRPIFNRPKPTRAKEDAAADRRPGPMTKIRTVISADLSIADRTPAAVCALLNRLADETGDDAFRRAARALRQLPPGRAPIDDDALLRQVRRLLDDRKAISTRHALMIVAHGDRAIVERLRRKFMGLKKRVTK